MGSLGCLRQVTCSSETPVLVTLRHEAAASLEVCIAVDGS